MGKLLKIILVAIIVALAVFAANKKTLKQSFFAGEDKTPKTPRIETLSLSDVIMFHKNRNNIFIDVREKEFYDYAHIPGAMNIPLESFETIPQETVEKLKAAPNIVVYCTSPSCGISHRAAILLFEKGIGNVKIYPDGWAQWKACELPVESFSRN